jgi:hypothetical protein
MSSSGTDSGKRSGFFGRKRPSPKPTPKMAVKSHHRHAPQGPKIEPAPSCLPEGTRLPVTIQVKGWKNAVMGNVVRVDTKTRQVLVALPASFSANQTQSGTPGVIGWPGHDVWHESKTTVTSKLKSGSRFVWMRMDSTPIHHERRRFVRAKEIRPVALHKGRHRVQATSMDLSEAAIRVVMPMGEPIHAGDEVHMLFSTTNRFRGEVVPLAMDGHVYRTRELTDGQAGRKEVVVFFENLSPSTQDFIRGIVYDLHLQDRRPTQED